MITPSKYENLNNSILVLGAIIIKLLKRKSYSLENLFRALTRSAKVHPDEDLFYDVITFLWLTGCIDYSYSDIKLVRTKPADDIISDSENANSIEFTDKDSNIDLEEKSPQNEDK